MGNEILCLTVREPLKMSVVRITINGHKEVLDIQENVLLLMGSKEVHRECCVQRSRQEM